MLVQIERLPSIQDATLIAERLLINLASSPNFLSVISTSFGTNFNPQKIANLQQAWSTENFSGLPPIEIRSRQELQGAEGAFSKTTGKIYLAREYLIQHENHPLAISNVLLEEIGHWVDAEINLEETPGDEGAIFSALVQGKILSQEQLLQLREEDDSALTILDGKVVELEQAIVSVTPIIDNEQPEDDFLLYDRNSIPIDVSRFESPRFDALQAFDEKKAVTLSEPLVTNQFNQWSQESTIIPAGTIVDSHYIWLAPDQNPRLRVTAQFTFEQEVLGVIAWGDNLLDTNDLLGLNNVIYSPLETSRLDNNEEFPEVDDVINLIDANTLEISLSNDSGLDPVRVITASSGPTLTVVNPMTDISVDEDAVDTQINLSTVFTDSENDDLAITKVVAGNSDSTLVDASLNGNILTLDYLENQSGTAEITIEATSNTQTVTDTFTVNINPVDDPPTIINPIADVTVDEDAANSLIDLSIVFSDIDNVNLSKSVTVNSNPLLVNATVDGESLTLNYLENQSGTAEITVQAESNAEIVTDTFTVTVNPVDTPPTVVNPISDITVDEDSDSITINLSGVFTDSDNEDADITKVVANSNPSIIATNLEEEILTLDLQENQSGSVEISVEATSNAQTVTDTFTVNITAIDDAPVVDSSIEDITVDQNSEETVIDLSNIFTDIDNDDAAITTVVSANSNSSVVAATVDENQLTLNYLEDQFGSADITIQASSNGQTVTDTFTVTVNEVADLTPDPLPSDSDSQDDQNSDTPDEDASEETPSETPVDNNAVSQPLFDLLPLIQATVTPLPTQSTLPGVSDDDNIMLGTDNSELIDLGLGNDNVVAIAGNDYVLGGDGNDMVSANTGNDFVDGGTGNDTLYGGKDPDTIIGGAGEDSVFGNIGDDYLNTGEGNDWANGNQGNDTVIAGEGDDQLYGGQDDDVLMAESGNDIVNGDNGNDTLVGTRPNFSGAEVDTLEGGAGDDLFVLGDAQQAYYTTADSNAIITDFEAGEDKIQLHGTFSDYEVVVDGDNVNLLLNTELIAVIEDVSSLSESDVIFGSV